jgi:phosphoribosylformimino-5-aminoimidazole carboxamide ribotide isomerase
MHIYPAIDLRDGRCVRLRQGDYSQETIFGDDPAAVARRWVQAGADRLHLVDLDGAKAGKPVNEKAIRGIVESAGVPCQLGGGIRTDADVETVFRWGVRWAVLGSRAAREPGWVRHMAGLHPARIVLGVDARDGFVATDGWQSTTTLHSLDLIGSLHDLPLAAIVYTDIATDGMMAGPNLEQLKSVAAATRIPVIASGGVSSLEDVKRLIALNLFGCIIGRALYEGAIDLAAALALTLPRPA